jgi:predicted small lipoprotein YifL
MLRELRCVPRTTRRLATLAAAVLVVATVGGCGIKGPLKRADAVPAATAPTASTPAPAPVEPVTPRLQ